jgi:hypothetical protein
MLYIVIMLWLDITFATIQLSYYLTNPAPKYISVVN